MAIDNDALLDLLQTTTATLPWDGRFSKLLQKTNYVGLNDFLVKRHKIEGQGGTTLDWRVHYRDNGQGKATRINAETSPGIINTLVDASLPWKQYETNWTTNRQEMLRNRSRAKLIDMVQLRRYAGMESLANVLETDIWTAIPLTTNKLVLYPVDYWLPKRAASAADNVGGWNGQNPTDAAGSSFSDCAGIDASDSTYSKWRSYNARWLSTDGSIVKADLSRVRRLYHNLNFQAPAITDGEDTPRRALSFYCNMTTLLAMEDTADSRNDNLGQDVARVAGSVVIKGIPLKYVYQLDSDTSNPLYAINHNLFNVCVMKGDYFRESKPLNSVELHNTFTTFVDLTVQTRMEDRQKGGGVISYQ